MNGNRTELTDAQSIEQKTGLAEPGKHRECGFIIPAGILIGLGAGMLAGHAGAGFLAGLGFGLLGAGLLPLARKSELVHPPGNADVTLALIGAFLVFVGACVVLAPEAIWPYAVAGFLILLGAWFLVRGFVKIPCA